MLKANSGNQNKVYKSKDDNMSQKEGGEDEQIADNNDKGKIEKSNQKEGLKLGKLKSERIRLPPIVISHTKIGVAPLEQVPDERQDLETM